MKMKTLKRFASICAAAAMCMAFAVPQAWADAEDATATIELKGVEGQSAVDVVVKAGDPASEAAPTLRDVTALSLALDIEITGGDPAQVTESFAFSDEVKALNPTIMRASMPQTGDDASVVRMNLYLAGMEDALASKALNLGRVNLTVAEGATAQAKVVVPDTIDALCIVGNSYDETDIPSADLYVPETPTVQLGDTYNPPAVTPDDEEEDGGSDIVGQTPGTNANKGLAATGDALMPVIAALACVAVVAIIVIIVMVVRRRKVGSDEPAGDDAKEE